MRTRYGPEVPPADGLTPPLAYLWPARLPLPGPGGQAVAATGEARQGAPWRRRW